MRVSLVSHANHNWTTAMNPKPRITKSGAKVFSLHVWLPEKLHETLLSEVIGRGYPADKQTIALEWLRAGSRKKSK